MPRIKLKPNSPEFAENTSHIKHVVCDMPGCKAQGEHKAPKHRGLNEYYMFCMDHVKEYNNAWDFFSGMSSQEVEDYMINSLYGNRPTWKYGVNGEHPDDILMRAAWQTYQNKEDSSSHSYQHGFENSDSANNAHSSMFQAGSPEFEALAIMGLEPPITLENIKTRYKELAKKHHPDLNRGCEKSETLLKQINMAYTILKCAYEQFESLPVR